LYSEIYQITRPIRRMAAFLAGQSYVVGAPEVYHEYEPLGTVLAYDVAGTDRGNDLKFTKETSAFDSDARAGLDYLAGDPRCTGRLGVMGICLGAIWRSEPR
jgi:carboxymethylenebutenolidase